MSKEIILAILRARVAELLSTIHSKYPEEFKNENVPKEIDIIMNSIIENAVIQTPSPIQTSKQPPVAKSKVRKQPAPIPSEQRCNARIWDSIFDKVNNKEVSDVDSKFKITDFSELKIKEFVSRYSIGKQCGRKKKTDCDYCFQHSRHNPHGDYFKDPPNWLCFHYMKDGNYLV